MMFLTDMAFWMSNFDDFDSDQISWKLAKREPFVFAFYSKIFLFLGNHYDSEKHKMRPFENHPMIIVNLTMIEYLENSLRDVFAFQEYLFLAV